jgi:hypothetical protein
MTHHIMYLPDAEEGGVGVKISAFWALMAQKWMEMSGHLQRQTTLHLNLCTF